MKRRKRHLKKWVKDTLGYIIIILLGILSIILLIYNAERIDEQQENKNIIEKGGK